MGVCSFIGRTADGIFSMIVKFFIIILAIVLVVALLVTLAADWIFTVMLMIGILFSNSFYKWIDKKLKLELPEYFQISIEDFLSTFREGDEEVRMMGNMMDEALRKARAEAEDMHNALISMEDQYKNIKTKRSLKTLFAKEPEDISPRMAKALEMELGKPKWTQYIDKISEDENGSWNKYKF